LDLRQPTQDKQPLRPDVVLSRIIRRTAVRAGIKKRIGWHTFRHPYLSALIANGENVKVVQELIRHEIVSRGCSFECIKHFVSPHPTSSRDSYSELQVLHPIKKMCIG
jgi:hypothetical protein